MVSSRLKMVVAAVISTAVPTATAMGSDDSLFAVMQGSEIQGVADPRTGETAPVFHGSSEAPSPDCKAQNGWYIQSGTRILVHCGTGQKYMIEKAAGSTSHPANYQRLRPLGKPGSDDPGPMERDR